MEYFLATKWATGTSSYMDESQKHYTQWKKTDKKGYILCGFIYNIQEKATLKGRQQFAGCPGLGHED